MNHAKRPFLRKTLSCTPDCETNEKSWISTGAQSFQHNSTGSSFQNSSFQNSSFQNSSFQSSGLPESGFSNSNFQISSYPNSSLQISSCPISSCQNPNLYNLNSSSSFKNSNYLRIQHSVSTNLGKSDTSDGKLSSSSNIYAGEYNKNFLGNYLAKPIIRNGL